MTKKRGKKELPIIALDKRQSDEVWNDLFIKEEGVILEFDPVAKTGRIQSKEGGNVYDIEASELLKKRIDIKSGDKVIFAPFEDPDGKDYARVVRIGDLKV